MNRDRWYKPPITHLSASFIQKEKSTMACEREQRYKESKFKMFGSLIICFVAHLDHHSNGLKVSVLKSPVGDKNAAVSKS